MRNSFSLLLLLLFTSCEDIFDVKKVEGPCTIELSDGRTITTDEVIEIMQSTGTITYRDQDGKIWSLTADKYESYTCGN
jgi:hypothetical protein